MATLRVRLARFGGSRGQFGGQLDVEGGAPLLSVTLDVGAMATAGSGRPTVPDGVGRDVFAVLVAADAPVYAAIGPAPDPTVEPRHLVLPGAPLRVHVAAGDRISAVLAGDIVLSAGFGPAGVLTVVEQPFRPLPGATRSIAAGPVATAAGALPLAAAGSIPTGAATSYRVRNAQGSASAITWLLTADAAGTPTIPAPAGRDGAGGTPGDATLDPGGVEIVALTAAQQAALAAGTLYLSAITPAGGSGTLSITPGVGG